MPQVLQRILKKPIRNWMYRVAKMFAHREELDGSNHAYTLTCHGPTPAEDGVACVDREATFVISLVRELRVSELMMYMVITMTQVGAQRLQK
jgi:hypothetical protein